MTITNSLAGNDTSPMQQQENTSNHDKHMKCATHLLSIMNWIAVRNQGKGPERHERHAVPVPLLYHHADILKQTYTHAHMNSHQATTKQLSIQ